MAGVFNCRKIRGTAVVFEAVNMEAGRLPRHCSYHNDGAGRSPRHLPTKNGYATQKFHTFYTFYATIYLLITLLMRVI